MNDLPKPPPNRVMTEREYTAILQFGFLMGFFLALAVSLVLFYSYSYLCCLKVL